MSGHQYTGHFSKPRADISLSIPLHVQNTNLEDVVGTNLRVKFLEADPETGRMVFSARRAQIFKQIGALSVSAGLAKQWRCCCTTPSAALPGNPVCTSVTCVVPSRVRPPA